MSLILLNSVRITLIFDLSSVMIEKRRKSFGRPLRWRIGLCELSPHVIVLVKIYLVMSFVLSLLLPLLRRIKIFISGNNE